ncbi:hypothetical protein LB554_16535, partial [Mesorhizobium sp. CO1-1-11]|uniref:hypothetical protein n=1 Tax=Mesorhizobium sp. CO1-1-11 TaxID=2876636 RepID=UPI001CCA180D
GFGGGGVGVSKGEGGGGGVGQGRGLEGLIRHQPESNRMAQRLEAALAASVGRMHTKNKPHTLAPHGGEPWTKATAKTRLLSQHARY